MCKTCQAKKLEGNNWLTILKNRKGNKIFVSEFSDSFVCIQKSLQRPIEEKDYFGKS